MRLRALASILSLLVLSFAAQAQDPANWIRVQSDDGKFSIDVPSEHTYIFDKKGFEIGGARSDHELREVSLLNSYSGGTLLTVESYKAPGDAMDALYETSKPRTARESSSTVNGVKVKHFENKTDKTYLVSYYMRDKERIYIVTAAARVGETPGMKRFIGSLRFDPAVIEPVETAVKFSSLKRAEVSLKTKDVKPVLTPQPGDLKKEPEPGLSPLIILSKPRASYTKNARIMKVTGGIKLRLELSDKGSIPNIDVIETLPEGLARQALFAALRIKFLPKEKDGRPLTSRITLEYTFTIY